MKTFADVILERRSADSNNFLLLRLLAATLVVYGHSFVLAAACDTCKDVSSWITSDPEILSHRIGLFTFFVISGFLVTKSSVESRTAFSYFIKRALRIFPALVNCALITTFVLGLAFTAHTWRDYLTDPATWRYFFTNATTYKIEASLPGVSLRDGKFSTAINGSLWTIPVEVRLYILVGIASVAAYKSRIALNLLAALLIAASFFDFLPMIQHGVWEYRLAALFAIGALIYVNRKDIPYSPAAAVLLISIAALSSQTKAFYPLCGLALAYGVLIVGYGRKIALPRWIGDYSYGIYLYAFPLQQLIAHYFPEAGPFKMMAMAIPLAWIMGAISWHMIESTFLAMKPGRNLTGDYHGETPTEASTPAT